MSIDLRWVIKRKSSNPLYAMPYEHEDETIGYFFTKDEAIEAKNQLRNPKNFYITEVEV